MNRSTPGLPVHHQLLEFMQTHIHRVGDAIQPSHPLLSPPPPAPNPSQCQGFFLMSQLCMGTLNGIIQLILPLSLQLCLVLLALAEKFRPLHISGLF